MKSTARVDTREAILDVARETVQKDGYNALSFRDLAAAVGVKSSSVHYHFPTKEDLAQALVARYCETIAGRLAPALDLSFEEAMDAYVGLFRGAFAGRRVCLVGMFSAEISALPPSMPDEIQRFAKVHTDWLTAVLRKRHAALSDEQIVTRARAIFAALEGAQLIAHGLGNDAAAFDQIVDGYRASGLLA